MLMKRIVLPLLAVSTLLSTSPASADHFRRFRCQEAQQNLNGAQAGLNYALLILSQANNICGGAIACIITAQHAYNQALVNLQQAQQNVRFACRPRPPGGGWGQPPRPRPPRPFPPRPFPPGPVEPQPFPDPGMPDTNDPTNPDGTEQGPIDEGHTPPGARPFPPVVIGGGR